MSRPQNYRWIAVLAVVFVGLVIAVPMTATADSETASTTQEEEPTKFTATSGNGELQVGGDEGQTIEIGSGDIVIEGEAYQDGTWESTDVEFADIEAGVSASVTTPNGLSGEYDPESETFTVEGEIVISVLGDEFQFDLAAESEAGETNLGENGGRAVVADDTFSVDATGNPLIDDRLGLPAESGENSMRVPFDIETPEDIEPPEDDEPPEETEPPELTATPESIQFDGVTVGETATKTVTIANTGGEPLELQRAALQDWPGELSVEQELPLELTPGEQRQTTITFAPERTGIRSTSLILVGDRPSLREVLPVASGSIEAEVTTDDRGRTRINASVQNARANEPVSIAAPDDTDAGSDDEFKMGGFEVTPAEDVDMQMEIETSNRSLETTPETETGLSPNAAQLGNISVEMSISPEQTERVEIMTRVNKSRLNALDTDPGNVTLYRFNESEDRWRAQDTEVVSESADAVRVRSIADHASEWTAAAARPEFEIASADVNVDVATVGETVTIDVLVENTGGTEGTYVADLLLNGEVVDSKDSVIGAGGEALFDFERSFDQSGDYEVQINEELITEISVTSEGVDTDTEESDESTSTDDAEESDGTEETTTSENSDSESSSDGSGPGFGVLVAVVAVAAVAVGRQRT